eukprot:gene2446-2782_t
MVADALLTYIENICHSVISTICDTATATTTFTSNYRPSSLQYFDELSISSLLLVILIAFIMKYYLNILSSTYDPQSAKSVTSLTAHHLFVGQYSMVVGDAVNGEVGNVGEKFFFQVLTYSRNGERKKCGGDVVTVHVQGCDYHNLDEDVKVVVVDKRNGTHHVYYNATKSGHYLINVFVNHVSVPGSPFKVDIAPKADNLIAGEEFTFEISPLRMLSHTINDRIDIDTYITENGSIKKTNNDFTVYTSGDPDSFHGRGKLIRSGEYTLEGSISGTVVFSKTIIVAPGPVSAKYSHLVWDGIELISENKLFILREGASLAATPNMLKFLVQTKDQFGNISKGNIDRFDIQALQSLSPITAAAQSSLGHLDGADEQTRDGLPLSGLIPTRLHPTLVSDDPRGLIVNFEIQQCGWYHINIKLEGNPITNCPFTLIAVKETDFHQLSSKYQNGSASFACQIEKNKKLTNKIEITESYYVMNVTLYEFTINPTVQNELLIKDNKSKVYLKNCSNSFLILLTTYYFFGDQTEPTFDSKVKWFKSKLANIQTGRSSPLKINISSRDNILEESLAALKSIEGKDLVSSRIIVKFLNEEGVDIGGISKEWFSKLSEELGRKTIGGYPLFEAYPSTNVFHPSAFSHLVPDYRSVFRTIGKLAAKSIYESIIKADRHLSIRFTSTFYKMLINEPFSMADIEAIDPELYRNKFQFILKTPMDTVNDILGEPLYFVHHISYQSQDGATPLTSRSTNLKPFGNLIRVTDENKVEYLELLVNNMLYGTVKTQIEEFKEGFFQLIPANLISIFSWKELEILICGKTNVNIDDLKTHSNVTGFVSQEIIDHFWGILNEFGEKERKQLLKFVTGSSSVPLGGFYQLYPHFTINITPNNSANRLPVSHTCFNRIDIPRGCSSYHSLKQTLVLAINEASEGFSLV